MHKDEIEIDVGLVAHLVEAQFPQWARLPLSRTGAHGTDHAIFRLGDDLAVRLPRHPGAAEQVEKEGRWSPWLAPRLPAPIPAPMGRGAPSETYPYPWSISPWLEGETAAELELSGDVALGRELGVFVTALRSTPAENAPGPGQHNAWRGVALKARDKATRRAIDELGDRIDSKAALAAWEAALDAPAWEAASVWLHGDLMPSNLLLRDGHLAGVLDFGCMGVGDPACDLIPGWNLLAGEGRAAFREASGADEASWARGRGWALSVALIQLPYYQDSNPVIAANARRTIGQVLGEA